MAEMEHADKNKMLKETKNDFQELESSARSLDIARNSSIDLASLNNKIVNMRSSVRQAKVRVIHKLTRSIEMLKKKKGTEKQLEKLKGKKERLLEEIRVIKSVNLDKVSKYALWNTSTLDEICKQPTSSIQSRALTRLAECCIIQDKVKEFRRCHSDWRSLAAYLVMKQSGRRYKKKKNRFVKGSDVESTNIKARHVMTDTYLQHTLVHGEGEASAALDSGGDPPLSDRITELPGDKRDTDLQGVKKVARLPGGEGNKSPNDEQDKETVSDSVRCEDKSQKKNSSSCRKKSACVTRRLLKFFPDKNAESSGSDSEDGNSVSTAASPHKPLKETSRREVSDVNTDKLCDRETTQDGNAGIHMKRVTRTQCKPDIGTSSTDRSVSKTRSDSMNLTTAQTSTDESDGNIQSGKHPRSGKVLKRTSDSLNVSNTKKRGKSVVDSSSEDSEGENDKEKRLHSENKLGAKPKINVVNTDQGSKGISVSKKSLASDDSSKDIAVSKQISGSIQSSKGISVSKKLSASDEKALEDDSQSDDSESEPGNDDASDLSEEEDDDVEEDEDDEEDDDDMAELCVKKQQKRQTAQPPKSDSVNKEMVIKKLNMDTFSGDIDEDETSVVEDLPGFLVAEAQEPSRKKRKSDPFFMTSDTEEGDIDKENNSSDSDRGEQREVSDDEAAGYEHIQKARHAFKSDFVDKLGSTGYRRYDWTRQKGGVEVRGRSTKRGSLTRGGGSYRDSRNEWVTGFDGHKRSSQNPWQKHKGSLDFQNRKPHHGGPFNRKMDQPDRKGPEWKESSEVLHPSWEASKRRKEQATIHAFQGKKIKFDD